jgi:hypothetical protein
MAPLTRDTERRSISSEITVLLFWISHSLALVMGGQLMKGPV